MDNGGGAGGQRPGESGQREESEYPAVCVVTHPLGAAGENATRTLLEILGAITAVSLVTANLPGNSTIRDRYEVVELDTTPDLGGIPLLSAGNASADSVSVEALIDPAPGVDTPVALALYGHLPEEQVIVSTAGGPTASPTAAGDQEVGA